MTIFHTSIITTLQPPKEKQIIPVFNGVGTQRATLKNISIKWGTGTYKLQKPNGSKEGIISWSQYGEDKLIDKLLNRKRNGFFVEIVGYDGDIFKFFIFRKRMWEVRIVSWCKFVHIWTDGRKGS